LDVHLLTPVDHILEIPKAILMSFMLLFTFWGGVSPVAVHDHSYWLRHLARLQHSY